MATMAGGAIVTPADACGAGLQNSVVLKRVIAILFLASELLDGRRLDFFRVRACLLKYSRRKYRRKGDAPAPV